MSSVLIMFLGVLVVPLFLASWRASLFGLTLQGLLMAWLLYLAAPDPTAPAILLGYVDLGLLRAVIAPLLLYRVLTARGAAARNDVLPPNLLSWTAALAAVLVAFQFAAKMGVPAGVARTQLAVAASGVLLAFLVLGTQSGPFSQMVGALRLENALALFELDGRAEATDLPLRGAQLVILIGSLVLFRWYLTALAPVGDRGAAEDAR